MGTSLTVYKSSSMSDGYSSDGSFATPIVFGSILSPLNGLYGDISPSVPLWVKNTGTEKLYGLVVLARGSSSHSIPGAPSDTADAFMCIAMDSSERPPQPLSPPSGAYSRALSSSGSASLVISNTVTVSGTKKNVTGIGRDDDSRTMLPGEYAVVWVRCEIDASRSVNGALPTPAGIKNIIMRFSAVTSSFVSEGASSIPASVNVLVIGHVYFDMPGKVYIEGVVSRWKMNTGSGSVLEDERGRHDGDMSGCVWWPVGLEGGSIALINDSYVDFGDHVAFNPGMHSFTVTVAFKTPYEGGGGTILSKMGYGGGFLFRLNPNGTLTYSIADSATTITLSTGLALNDSGWHVATAVNNRVVNTLMLILDGEVAFESDISTMTNSVSNAENMQIGGPDHDFTGRVDEISFVLGVQSVEELLLEYQSLWDAYIGIYGVTDEGVQITDENGRPVTEEEI